MDFNLDSIINAFIAISAWEVVGTFLGIIYLILATKESLWAWFFGFFSTLIYTIIFWEGALVSSSFLNFYYMIMSIYGYYSWNKTKEDGKLKISQYNIYNHLKVITIGIVFTLLIGYLSHSYTNSNFPFMDSFVMVFSILATWMLTQKILENWLYWMVIDAVAIVLYWNNGYLVTVILFIIYIILGVYGYLKWRKEFHADR